jgi:microcompartment protein CcmK/EutM
MMMMMMVTMIIKNALQIVQAIQDPANQHYSSPKATLWLYFGNSCRTLPKLIAIDRSIGAGVLENVLVASMSAFVA